MGKDRAQVHAAKVRAGRLGGRVAGRRWIGYDVRRPQLDDLPPEARRQVVDLIRTLRAAARAAEADEASRDRPA